MSYKHIFLTVDPKYNAKATDFADVLRERGQACDVDGAIEGIHKKLDRAQIAKYDFIHVMNTLEHEINYTNFRILTKTGGYKCMDSLHIVDFLHNLACGKYESE